ncbi:hypothetical protein GQ42DRAFT_177802 [Ramicandelaber brevisporus]|nr:hypothetical protein GQ42DRAFT_177802 [Ramicandelaber brevisporus]
MTIYSTSPAGQDTVQQSAKWTYETILSTVAVPITRDQIEEAVSIFLSFTNLGRRSHKYIITCATLINQCNEIIDAEAAMPTATSLEFPPSCTVALRAVPQLMSALKQMAYLKYMDAHELCANVLSLAARATADCDAVIASRFWVELMRIGDDPVADVVVEVLCKSIIGSDNGESVAALKCLSNLLESDVTLEHTRLTRIRECTLMAAGQSMHLNSPNGIDLIKCAAALIQRVMCLDLRHLYVNFHDAIHAECVPMFGIIASAMKVFHSSHAFYNAVADVARVCRYVVNPFIVAFANILDIQAGDGDSLSVKCAKLNCAKAFGLIDSDLDIDLDIESPEPELEPEQEHEQEHEQEQESEYKQANELLLHLNLDYKSMVVATWSGQLAPVDAVLLAVKDVFSHSISVENKYTALQFLDEFDGDLILSASLDTNVTENVSNIIAANASKQPQALKDSIVAKFGGLWYEAFRNVTSAAASFSTSDMDIDVYNIPGAASFVRLLYALSPTMMYVYLAYAKMHLRQYPTELINDPLHALPSALDVTLSELADIIHSKLVHACDNQLYAAHVAWQHSEFLLDFAHHASMHIDERIDLYIAIGALIDLAITNDRSNSPQYLIEQFRVRITTLNLLGKAATIHDVESCILPFVELNNFGDIYLYIDHGLVADMEQVLFRHRGIVLGDENLIDMLASVNIPGWDVLHILYTPYQLHSQSVNVNLF